MISAPLPLVTSRERQSARDLVHALGLGFEEPLDDLVGLFDDGELIGTAARAGYVLKQFAIRPEHQGGEILGGLVGALLERARLAGEETLLVFTRPESASSFEHLGFRLLATSGAVSLLETGPGIGAYLETQAPSQPSGESGAVVINGNPFTLGHLYLVESAAPQVDHLYVFIVREDCSEFPFVVRRSLAELATRHLPNVSVHDTSRYAVSAATFPSYFLRHLDERAQEQMQIDLELFARRLAPAFGVRLRFVGHEPYSEVTAAYNRMMRRLLPPAGIEVRELDRRRLLSGDPESEFISATRVRADFIRGDFEHLSALVPATTLDFLRSAEGEAVRRRLTAA